MARTRNGEISLFKTNKRRPSLTEKMRCRDKKNRIMFFFFFIVPPTRTYRSGPVPVRQAGRKTYGY